MTFHDQTVSRSTVKDPTIEDPRVAARRNVMHAAMHLEHTPLEYEKGRLVYRGQYLVTLAGMKRVVMTRESYEQAYGADKLSDHWQHEYDAASAPTVEGSAKALPAGRR